MCGIAGYIGSAEIPDPRIQETLARMRRRGPDDAGFRRFRTPSGGHVCLLHSRLGIIDLDARANQPFRRGDTWLTYNGELYNFVELRAELEQSGESFETRSDTEVLAACVARGWRESAARCEGMWAFAAYSEKEGSLLLSRDRFGEKPLYLYRDATGLYFGSEIKLLAALAGRRFEPDLGQLTRYLVNGYKSLYKSGRTFFQGVTELPAATDLRIDGRGEAVQEPYWRPELAPDQGMTREEAVERTRELLLRSVQIRLRADVPLAFCMSGGIDSLAIISLAKKVLGYDVHGFTIENHDPRYDERPLVKLATETLGLKHTSLVPSGSTLGQLRELVRYHDAPVYTISYLVHWLLMQRVSEAGYRISVSGTAADELFTGYFDHHLQYLAEIHGDRAAHEAYLRAWSREVKPIVRNPYLSDPDLFVRDPAFRGHIYLGAERFAAMLKVPFAEPFEELPLAPGSVLRNRMLNELCCESVPVILHEDDLNAMYFSVENRSPFLDRSLVEFSLTVPSPLLMRDALTKVLLRDAMRGIVPDPVLDSRRKVGFNAPVGFVLDTADPAVREELLDDGPIFELVERDAIEGLLAKQELPNSESKFLFNFACSKMFLEESRAA